jgi:agmatinase
MDGDANKTAIVGFPFDGLVTNRPGARLAPRAIRNASMMLCDGDHPITRIDPLTAMKVADVGDVPLSNDWNKAFPQVERTIAKLISEGHHPVSFGGDHSITLPILRAIKAKYGPVSLVHFDAHLDTWPTKNGEPSHGTCFRQAVEEGLIDPLRSIQLGIRSPAQKEVWEWTQDQGFTIYSASAIIPMMNRDPAFFIDEIEAIVGDSPAYFTFDIDCLDPAYAPGTGTPEIGGLASWQVVYLLNNLNGINWVGGDVVEVLPAYDVGEITALAGATIAWNYINMLARNKA